MNDIKALMIIIGDKMNVKGFHSIVYKGKNNGRIDVPESWIGEEVIVQLLPKKSHQKCESRIPVESRSEEL